MKILDLRFHYTFVIFSMLLALSACSVELISHYNATLVENLLIVQKQANTLLLEVKNGINTPKSNYSHYEKAYVEIEATLSTLVSNVSAIPNSEITVKQLKILQTGIAKMQTMHKRGFKSERAVDILRQTLNSEFTSIYYLQHIKESYLKPLK